SGAALRGIVPSVDPSHQPSEAQRNGPPPASYLERCFPQLAARGDIAFRRQVPARQPGDERATEGGAEASNEACRNAFSVPFSHNAERPSDRYGTPCEPAGTPPVWRPRPVKLLLLQMSADPSRSRRIAGPSLLVSGREKGPLQC